MTSPKDDEAELKVGAHVLIQLGSELVTDVEQAILECVKNAYDADSPGCLVEIDTYEEGEQKEIGTADKYLGFDKSFETVNVEVLPESEIPTNHSSEPLNTRFVTRRLSYTGRITIEDKGDGLKPEQLRSSWLVVSRSAKRSESGSQKQTTKSGRTPLGDKGLGRLGSMKLGDILRIETSTSKSLPIAVAQFRWTDCESASTIDKIPVFLDEMPNADRFKGTRVSVLGLRDLPEWRRKDRANEITKSLARLVSPFEATSSFPVRVKLDGDDHTLVSVTEEALQRAVAKFEFTWKPDPDDKKKNILRASAKFRKRLFTSTRGDKAKERTLKVFGDDDGEKFGESLNNFSRLKSYEKNISHDAPWFIELHRTFQWSDMQLKNEASILDPGAFSGAFYFFHLDKLELEEGETFDTDKSSVAGFGIDKELIKDMKGISILRDGFRVRSQGDWLGLSKAMTSGSTYGMRVDNTVGYFSLSGEKNYFLIEKSDREGFVEDAAYRGFMQIATQCRTFANETLEQVRRALDAHYKAISSDSEGNPPPTLNNALRELESDVASVGQVKDEIESLVSLLQKNVELIEKGSQSDELMTKKNMEVFHAALDSMESVKEKLNSKDRGVGLVSRLRHELYDRDEQSAALIESAAVGLSARGLAHEIRTHLTEIRQHTSHLEKDTGRNCKIDGRHLRAIRYSCSAISRAASLIDPMLPRTRAVKENIQLKKYFEKFFDNRKSVIERYDIVVNVSGPNTSIRMNRPRLAQVIDNLFRNSVYWLRRSEIMEYKCETRAISVETTKKGFIFSDTGPGVDTFYEDTVFEIFITAKPEKDTGQGLGLYIVNELLNIDGCSVELLRERNKHGRRFKFSVDLGPLIIKS